MWESNPVKSKEVEYMEISILGFTSPTQAEQEMLAIGVHPAGARIMAKKAIFVVMRLTAVAAKVANVMKQDMISAGGDAAVHMLSVSCDIDKTDVLLMGTLRQYDELLSKLEHQPWGMEQMAGAIRNQLALRNLM